MPVWLIPVITQFPIVLVIGFVAWYAYREVRRAYAGRLKREEENHATAVAAQKEFQQKLVEAKDAEIARLKDELRKDIDKMSKRVDELNRKLNT